MDEPLQVRRVRVGRLPPTFDDTDRLRTRGGKHEQLLVVRRIGQVEGVDSVLADVLHRAQHQRKVVVLMSDARLVHMTGLEITPIAHKAERSPPMYEGLMFI